MAGEATLFPWRVVDESFPLCRWHVTLVISGRHEGDTGTAAASVGAQGGWVRPMTRMAREGVALPHIF